MDATNKISRLLASGSLSTSSNGVATWLLMTAGIAFLALLACALLLRVALKRRGKHSEALLVVVLIWGLTTAGSISYALMRRMDFDAQLQQRILSGFYDPSADSVRPAMPVLLWLGLGAGYVVMVGWAALGPIKRAP